MEQLLIDAESPRQTYQVTLEGVQYRVTLTWRELCPGWYLDLYDVDGTAIIEGRRLSPGVSLNAGLPSGPPGLLFVVGDDPYEIDGLQLLYSPSDELAQIPETRPTVVLS